MTIVHLPDGSQIPEFLSRLLPSKTDPTPGPSFREARRHVDLLSVVPKGAHHGRGPRPG